MRWLALLAIVALASCGSSEDIAGQRFELDVIDVPFDRLACLLLHNDLDEVPAGVIEHGGRHWSEVGRWLGELDPGGAEPVVLGLDVIDGELGEWDAVSDQRVAVRLHGWVAGRFEEQLGAIGRRRCDHREPGVVSDWDVVVLWKPRTSV
jgi:hypothetical protein